MNLTTMSSAAFLLCALQSPVIGAQAGEVFASPAQVQPLLIGSEVPSATVQRLDGSEADLRDVVGKKKAVVIFYRGGW